MDILPKVAKTWYTLLSFLGYLGEVESDSQNVCAHYCARASGSNFQVLICSGSRGTVPSSVFGWPSLYAIGKDVDH